MESKISPENARQSILWGTKRHIYEFIFMFSNLFHYIGYIPVDKDAHYNIAIDELNFDDLENICDKKFLIIICDIDISQYVLNLQKHRFASKIEYVHFKDYFKLLDTYNNEILHNRKIAVWGTGETEKNFNAACKKNGYQIEVSLYIDNNAEKNNMYYRGCPVKIISDINDISQYFIIVASIYYDDIKTQLNKYGLIEGKDYLPFSVFWSKPSSMLETLVEADRIPDFYCNRPYTWFYYTWFGAYLCCSTWVEYPIGNPASDSPEQCWNSTVAKLYRLSAENGTYCFCKKEACSKLHNSGLKEKKVYDFKIPEKITLGLDYTCNLSCTSCRDHIQVATGNQLKIREHFANKILQTKWLEKTKILELSGSGEALASKIDQKVLFSNDISKRESISLLSNGILLNSSNLQKLKKHFKKICINISIDAASENTYNCIRRGGNWNILMNNLQNLSQMRRNKELEYIEIRMVVQKRNYKEIPDFIQMGKKYCMDSVVFTKLLNWDMYSDEEYFDQAMLYPNGQIKPELEQILRTYALNEKIAIISEFEHFFK